MKAFSFFASISLCLLPVSVQAAKAAATGNQSAAAPFVAAVVATGAAGLLAAAAAADCLTAARLNRAASASIRSRRPAC